MEQPPHFQIRKNPVRPSRLSNLKIDRSSPLCHLTLIRILATDDQTDCVRFYTFGSAARLSLTFTLILFSHEFTLFFQWL